MKEGLSLVLIEGAKVRNNNPKMNLKFMYAVEALNCLHGLVREQYIELKENDHQALYKTYPNDCFGVTFHFDYVKDY